jgi:hypothetical protein
VQVSSSDVNLGPLQETVMNQEREIVRHLDSRAPPKMSIDAEPHVFQ